MSQQATNVQTRVPTQSPCRQWPEKVKADLEVLVENFHALVHPRRGDPMFCVRTNYQILISNCAWKKSVNSAPRDWRRTPG
jgi:hypothetical protein